MSVLLDTNVLTRLADPHGALRVVATAATNRLIRSGETLHIVPQNLYEFWSVATRPLGENGLGLTTARTKEIPDALRLGATLLPDSAAITTEWERLVIDYDAKGKTAHDTRLVAAMHVHQLTSLLTFNLRDFARYRGITILNPAELAK